MRWRWARISALLLRRTIMLRRWSTGELPFLLTSCCPSWAVLAKKYFPDVIDEISQELTPMVATARTIKAETSECKSCIYRALRVKEAGGIQTERKK